jgi:hypothetical protein
MTIDEIKIKLTSMGFQIKSASGKTIDIIVDDDRVGALVAISKAFGGKYNPTGGQSSVGRAELPMGVMVNAKPSKGGSGAGSAVTKLAESAQCLYCAAAWYGKDFSKNTLKSVAHKVQVDESIHNILTALPDVWVKSSMLTATTLKKKYSNKYTFHRGSKWVNVLQNHWKNLNRTEKYFANINKWSPADIYMMTTKGERVDVTKTKSLLELNALLKANLDSGDIIGVSLKQVQSTPKIEFKNVGAPKNAYQFKSSNVGKRGFFESNDGYIEFNTGSAQFRTFGTTWQGEIKGKTANNGKISGGRIAAIMKEHSKGKWKLQNEITTPTEELIDQLYNWYKALAPSALPKNKFLELFSKKDRTFWISKFMTAQLMFYISQSKKKDEIVSAMITYAASESELSAPYIKVS